MRDDAQRSRNFAKALRTRMTEPEAILWSQLREWRRHGYAFRRQHPIGPYIADFAYVRGRLVIELDGEQHGSDQNHARDRQRDSYMAERGWHVIRISNDRIYKELGSVLNMLSDVLPPPPPDGGTSPATSIGCGAEGSSPRGRKE